LSFRYPVYLAESEEWQRREYGNTTWVGGLVEPEASIACSKHTKVAKTRKTQAMPVGPKSRVPAIEKSPRRVILGVGTRGSTGGGGQS